MVESVLNGGNLHALIFTHLSPREWGLVCAPVCKVWRRIAYCNSLWIMVWQRVIAKVPALCCIEIDGYACGYKGREWCRVIYGRLRTINRIGDFTSLILTQIADLHLYGCVIDEIDRSSVITFVGTDVKSYTIIWSSPVYDMVRHTLLSDECMEMFSRPICKVILDEYHTCSDSMLGHMLGWKN